MKGSSSLFLSAWRTPCSAVTHTHIVKRSQQWHTRRATHLHINIDTTGWLIMTVTHFVRLQFTCMWLQDFRYLVYTPSLLTELQRGDCSYRSLLPAFPLTIATSSVAPLTKPSISSRNNLSLYSQACMHTIIILLFSDHESLTSWRSLLQFKWFPNSTSVDLWNRILGLTVF